MQDYLERVTSAAKRLKNNYQEAKLNEARDEE